MRTEQEVRDLLAKCERARRKFDTDYYNMKCPMDVNCCPECTTHCTLQWVLNRKNRQNEQP